MRRLTFIASVFLALAFTTTMAFSATFSIDLYGIPDPSGIETFQAYLEVSDDFAYVQGSLTLGADIPASPADDFLFPWEFFNPDPAIDENSFPGKSVFTVDLYNSDLLDGPDPTVIPNFGQVADGQYNENNLVEGQIAFFEYSAGQILGVAGLFANDSSNRAVDYEIRVSEFGPEGMTVSNVPIPSTLLLLGGGLAGLVGLKRRKRG